jgi:hypothetical protein
MTPTRSLSKKNRPFAAQAQPWRLLFALLAFTATANAGNLERFSLGDDAALLSGSVGATTREPSAIYYNPAGLALLDRDSVDLGVSAYAARFYRIPGLVQVSLPDQKGALDFEGTSFFSTPAAVAFGWRLREGLGLGFAVFTRDQLDLLGLLSEEFRGLNGAEPYAYEQGLELHFAAKNYLGGFGLGWAATPKMRLGLSVFGEYLRQSVLTQFWGDYRELNSYNGLTGLYGTRVTSSFKQRLGVGAYGLRAVAGLQWDLGSGVSLGVVGRSPRFTGYQDVAIDLLLNGNAAQYSAVVQEHINGDGVTHPYTLEEPWRIHGSLAWTRGRLTLSAEADASDRPDDEGRGALWNWKAGASWRFNERWELGAGAYSDYAWGERIDAFAQSNMDYHGGSLGLRWRREIGKGVELSTTLAGHYERGTGDFVGAAPTASQIVFPMPTAKTNATFEEANVHLASGLSW